MLTKIKIAGLAVALMALSVPLVYADNGGKPMDGWHHGQKDHMMAKILGLSDDQVKQLKDSRQKQKDAMKSLFEQIKSDKESFDAEIIKATPDMNKINGIEAQTKTLLSQMVDDHLNSILDVKKIMTPEQFAGYMALKKERMMMRHHMMGHGKFEHKDGFRKDGDGHDHGHWGDEGDKGHSADSQD